MVEEQKKHDVVYEDETTTAKVNILIRTMENI